MNDEELSPARFSHIVGYAGPGSIVQSHDGFSLFVKDTSTWAKEEMTKLFAVARVKHHLKIPKNKDLLLPPEGNIKKNKVTQIEGGTIPAIIFPECMMCEKCGQLILKPWKEMNHLTQNLYCEKCKEKGVKLKQVSWCAISSYGGLCNVKWNELCHSSTLKCGEHREDYSNLKLVLSERGELKVHCQCGSSNSVDQANFHDTRHLTPCYSKVKPVHDGKFTYTITKINDPRVYSPIKSSALVIPPESNYDRASLVYRLEQHSTLVAKIREAKNKARDRAIREARKLLGDCSHDEVMTTLVKIEEQEKMYTSLTDESFGDMALDEYKALTTKQEFTPNADFITTHLTETWREFANSVKETSLKTIANSVTRLVAVDRLRVIDVLTGFKRTANDSEDETPDYEHPVDFSGETDWLPAMEMFGEGLFFTFNEKLLDRIEANSRLQCIAQTIEDRYQESSLSIGGLRKDFIPTPRFILLHTLAHILIRELEALAGYPAASISERIYASAGKNGMSGILIYTAAPDIAGTLGGIIELAKPEAFLRLLDSAFARAQWCSMDPVCKEMDGQGPSWLNRAACHGCALLPDTSCKYGNVFLDRAFIQELYKLLLNERVN